MAESTRSSVILPTLPQMMHSSPLLSSKPLPWPSPTRRRCSSTVQTCCVFLVVSRFSVALRTRSAYDMWRSDDSATISVIGKNGNAMRYMLLYLASILPCLWIQPVYHTCRLPFTCAIPLCHFGTWRVFRAFVRILEPDGGHNGQHRNTASRVSAMNVATTRSGLTQLP